MRHFFTLVLTLGLAAVSTGCRTTHAPEAVVYRLRVERGDNVAELARKYDTTIEAILRTNHLEPGTALVVGSVLRVQPGPAGLVAMPSHAHVASVSDGSDLGPEGDEEELDAMSNSHSQPHRGLLFGGGSGSRSQLEWPLYGTMTSPYGMRHGRFHRGIDIRAKKGTTVLAAAGGTVEFAGRKHGFGRVVIVRHSDCRTVYAHLDKIEVARGDRVDHSTELGLSGNSGHSTGPHLHFEIRNLTGDSLDPVRMISRERLLLSRNP